MWTQRTPAEIDEARRNRKRHRLKSALVVGTSVTLGTTFLFGWKEAADQSRFLVPANEILRRLPITIIVGTVVGLLSYRFGRERPTVVCLKCGLAKYAAESAQCSCGGYFEEIEKVKWA